MNQTTMNPFWMKCDNNAWCSLGRVDLSHKYYDNFEAVYIIWYWDNSGNPVTVRVGQGNLKDRLAAHRSDPQIQRYAHLNLLVTWTDVLPHLRNGVEVYLSKVLKPLVGSHFPDAKPIPVVPPFRVNPLWNRIDPQARPY